MKKRERFKTGCAVHHQALTSNWRSIYRKLLNWRMNVAVREALEIHKKLREPNKEWSSLCKGENE